ncbi:SusC/RagA family TonB-linked outer membrane protein [Wenyingzhuangia sp. IMCC45467]
MKLKTPKILMLLLAFSIQFSFAQTKTITGSVSDDSGPIPGATILIKGTSIGTMSDFDGVYNINAKEGDILIFSYVGMETIEKIVGTTSTVNAVLKGNIETLDEVVVTALGISKEKKAIGYAMTEIKGDEITKTQAINPMTAIQGKVSGLEVSSAPSPGGTQNVIIRGASSFGNVQPLYIVDGIVITNEQSRTGDNLNSQVDFGSGINAINPDDIENMSILKGAAATALYGSRAANGVILITTKSGKNGKLKVSFNSSVAISRVGFLADTQDQFGQGWSGDRALEENGNWGAAFDGVDRVWGNVINNSQQLKPYVALKDNIRDFYDYGQNIKNSLSVSGGDEKNTFFLSASQNTVDGVIPTDNDSYKRYTLSTKATHTTNKFKFGSAINFSREQTKSVPSGQGTSLSRSLREIPSELSIVDFKDLNNPFNTIDNYFTPYGINPYYILNNDGAEQSKYKFFGKFEIDYNIIEDLKLTYRFSGDYESATIDEHIGIIAFAEDSFNAGSQTVNPGSYSQTKRSRAQYSNDLMLSYQKDFTDDLNLSTIVGLNTNERTYSSLSGSISSIDVPGFYYLGNSLSPSTSTQDQTKRRLIGTYISADLGYNDYLFLNGTLRNDWSSTLPAENNSFLYGGLTASFILSKFLYTNDINFDALDYSKIRVAYGSTGDDASPYNVNDRYVIGQSKYPGYPNIDNLEFPLGGTNSYTASNKLGNKDLKPQITNEFEIGFENMFFGKRVGFEVSYYNRLTKGLIEDLPLDPSTGYTVVTANLGDVRNSGVELNVNLTPIKTSDFRWDVNWAYTKNNNMVEKLNIEEIQLTGFGGTSGGLYALEGMPMGQFKFTKAKTVKLDGVESIVVDGNGNPQQTTDMELLGKDVNEKYRMGLTNTFSYKGLSLTGTLDFRYGGYIYSGTKDYMHWTGSSPESVLNDRNAFLIPNSVVDNGDGTYSENSIPVNPTALHTFYSEGGMEGASYAVIDRSYLKLRNVTLAYSIPKSLCEKIKVSAVNLSFTASNFLLWTPKENPYIDPETTTFGNNINAKFGEYNANPTNEVFTFGLNIQL